MPLDDGSVRRPAWQDDQPSDAHRLPPAFASEQIRDDPELAPEGRQQDLQIGESRLNLDDQERPRQRVPPDDIDRSTLPVAIECVLEQHLPAQRPQFRHDHLDDRRVLPIDQPISVAAVPPEPGM